MNFSGINNYLNMNKKYDYIFIDLDGPILDGKYRHYNCYKDIILKDGGVPLDLNSYWNMKRNKINRIQVLKNSNYPETYENFLNQWLDCIEKKEYLEYDILKPNIISTLEKFIDYSDNIYLVTMRVQRANLLWQLEYHNLTKFFTSIINVGFKDESPKYKALKHLNIKKGIFIGDTEEDTKTAKMLNIKSIGITNGLREKKFLYANYYFEELFYIDLEKI
jgi:phosphoglycolate phosphatase-like HAD superfamily hydrolase